MHPISRKFEPIFLFQSADVRSRAECGRLLVYCASAVAFCFLLVVPVKGADLVVETLVDEVEANGLCSLREAVIAANDDLPGGDCAAASGWDRIRFAVAGPVMLSESLSVTSNVSILGLHRSQSIIDGSDAFQLLQLEAGNSLLLADLTLRNGWDFSRGGALEIAEESNVTIVDCHFEGNVGGFGAGAILMNNTPDGLEPSRLYVLRTEFASNEAQGSLGGGALHVGKDAVAVVVDSTFYGNGVVDGGSGDGGAIAVFKGHLEVLRSTISGNSSSDAGGGISSSFESTVVLRHSTVTNNSASMAGGGIRMFENTLSPTAALTMENSIVAGNFSGVSSRGASAGEDIAIEGTVTIQSDGTNFIGSNSTVESAFPAGSPNGNSDHVGTSAALLDPDLGALLDYGGPTQTREPNSSSGVVDAGSCSDQFSDQRAFVGSSGRAVGLGCDIGAVEFGAADSQPLFSSGFEPGTAHRWTSLVP